MDKLVKTGLTISRHIAKATVFCLFVVVSAQASPDQWRRAGFSTDFSKSTVDLGTIFSGGPPKDGIPSIDEPRFETATDIDWLEDREPVIRLDVDGIVRAYPLQILIWHEIVNDRIGSVPVSVTYCPLCNSSIAFDRRLDGETLDFGTTGLLRNSDLVMYDRQSETWWQQFTGEGIVGTHAGRDLKMLPSRVVSFAAFRQQHPTADVLARPVPARRDYGRNPYVGYDSRSAPFPLFQGDLPENINPMARVVLVRDGTRLHAATLEHIRNAGTVALTDETLLRWTGEQASILDASATGDGRAVGSVVAVRKTPEGEQALVHDVTFAFAVHAFHPDVPILGITRP
ncbi:DUF3179 domain-containing protein [Roseibium sp.]|uniref:DUF3179 domain-containing protein n=1 Tax=Roseibium sp. TaxID=1936156 RepID=UPI003BB072FC